MSLDRRRTYLNYLFENMTYLTKLSNNLYEGLELISGSDYKSRNLLNGHNLSSYNKLMLIFQIETSASWRADGMYITVLDRDGLISISSSYNPFISINGTSYNYSYIEFKNNELYFRLNGVSSPSNSSIRLIGDMFIIGINE